uniref:ZAD domain-containing protein n=1 Tax=Trichogramma kaykai TaxID=54128 RepID=A0ABD2WQX6_9HYME
MSEASATTSNAAADSGLHEQQAIGADDDAVNASTSIDYLDLCRLCLQKDAVNVPIFEDDGDSRQIFLKITATLPVKIFKEDKLPKKICDDCLYKVELLYQFWNQAATSEKQLLQWLGEVGLDDKQNYEVLEEDIMKQEKSNDNRLNTNIIQVSDQNSIEISMIDNISLITIPAGSEQFTTVPIDASGTIQTEAMQSSHDQSQIEEDRSEMGDMSDDGCDNEGLPVKEESDDQNNQTNMDQAYVSIEAGPSGLQHQKISEISELTIQQAADGDPKTG